MIGVLLVSDTCSFNIIEKVKIMKKSFITSGLIAAVAFTISPALARDANADDQAILAQFQEDVRKIENNLPSTSYDVAADGAKCSSDIDALVQALPATIETDYACDIIGTDKIAVFGGARLRR